MIAKTWEFTRKGKKSTYGIVTLPNGELGRLVVEAKDCEDRPYWRSVADLSSPDNIEHMLAALLLDRIGPGVAD